MTDVLAEARETSGATTGGLLRYVRAQAGDAAVTEVVRRAGVRAEPAELDDQSRWWSYDTRIRLFAAAPTLNIVSGSSRTSVAAAKSRMRVS